MSYAANSAATPWRTIGRAAWGSTNRDARVSPEAAQAGDTVIVAAGTYSGTGTNSRNEILYYQENSGSPGNPIVFLASGTVILTQTGRGAMIGAYQRNYITWDGFTIDEANALSTTDTGPTVIDGCTGCVLQNLDLTGNGTDGDRMDNHTGIRLESSTNITVRNNRIRNVYTGHNPNNGACIQTYQTEGILIEHNDLSRCGSGIFLKGGPWSGMATHSSIIRFNYIHEIGEDRGGGTNGHGIIAHAGAPYTAQNPLWVYQNVIRNGLAAAMLLWPLTSADPTGEPQYVSYVNNTVDRCQTGFYVQSTLVTSFGNRLWNNLITNSSQHAVAYNDTVSNLTKAHVDFDHNLYFGYNPFLEIGDGTRYTLANWQSTHNQDAAAPASLSVDPLFVNSAAGDYHLQGGSPARALGVDILDLNGNGSTTDIIPAGAYITGSEVIGPTTALPPPPPPSRCDLNSDTSTNVSDVQLCVIQAISASACTSGDINQDNSCNVIDVQRVVNAALGGQCVTQ